MNNNGPHGLSEILYAYSSGTGNNGSAFAGLNANTPWYNLTIGLAMLIGRFLIIIPMLAVAGSLAMKKAVPAHERNAPDTRTAVRRPAGRNRDHSWSINLFPGSLADANCRAFPDEQRPAFLDQSAIGDTK